MVFWEGAALRTRNRLSVRFISPVRRRRTRRQRQPGITFAAHSQRVGMPVYGWTIIWSSTDYLCANGCEFGLLQSIRVFYNLYNWIKMWTKKKSRKKMYSMRFMHYNNTNLTTNVIQSKQMFTYILKYCITKNQNKYNIVSSETGIVCSNCIASGRVLQGMDLLDLLAYSI